MIRLSFCIHISTKGSIHREDEVLGTNLFGMKRCYIKKVFRHHRSSSLHSLSLSLCLSFSYAYASYANSAPFVESNFWAAAIVALTKPRLDEA